MRKGFTVLKGPRYAAVLGGENHRVIAYGPTLLSVEKKNGVQRLFRRNGCGFPIQTAIIRKNNQAGFPDGDKPLPRMGDI